MNDLVTFDRTPFHVLLNVAGGFTGYGLGAGLGLDTGQKLLMSGTGVLAGNLLYANPKVRKWEVGQLVDESLTFSPSLVQVALQIALTGGGVFLGVELGGSFEEKLLIGGSLGGVGLLGANLLFNRYLNFLNKALDLPTLTDIDDFSKDPAGWAKENPIKLAQTLEIPFDMFLPPLWIARIMGWDPVEKIGHAIDPDAK